MDVIDGLKAFVATAQTGSFTAAADQLGVSNRLTSKYVAELESRLGTRLLQRTTRKVGLTPAGEGLLLRAPALLDDFDDMLAAASEDTRGLTGAMRVSAPMTFGEVYVACMLGRFTDRHPGVNIDLRLDDKYIDLAADGIDVAFRIGVTDTLSIKVKKLGEMRTCLVASPEYLTRKGTPHSVSDLTDHSFVLDSNMRNPKRWTLRKDGKDVVVDVEEGIRVNSARAACELAVAGRGISLSPMFAVSERLRSGELTTLLEDYEGRRNPVSAVYLEGRRLPRKVRALIDFASEDFKANDELWSQCRSSI